MNLSELIKKDFDSKFESAHKNLCEEIIAEINPETIVKLMLNDTETIKKLDSSVFLSYLWHKSNQCCTIHDKFHALESQIGCSKAFAAIIEMIIEITVKTCQIEIDKSMETELFRIHNKEMV